MGELAASPSAPRSGVAEGGDPADAFHLVIPSMPGYGFSGPIKEPGWSTSRVAQAWKGLMHALGYQRYGAQGGDWGAFVAPDLGRIDAEHVVGVHVNAATLGFIPFGPISDAELSSFARAVHRKTLSIATTTSGGASWLAWTRLTQIARARTTHV